MLRFEFEAQNQGVDDCIEFKVKFEDSKRMQ